METVVTHDALFYSDEIIAVALIKMTVNDPVRIVRSRNEEVEAATYAVSVGGKYDPKNGRYDHHQFKKDDPYYGLSSAGLVWRNILEKRLKGSENLSAFIEAVDARGTRAFYDPSNVYEPVFDAVTAFNDIKPLSVRQDVRFNEMILIITDIMNALVDKDADEYAGLIIKLERMAEENTQSKTPVFEHRKESVVELDDVAVSKFFPGWRKASRTLGKPFIMPGDKGGQYKIMTDTSVHQIATTRDEVFTHPNGFISVIDPEFDSTHFGITLTNGKLLEVPISEVTKVLGIAK